ncbi:MAG: hypothetical protein ABJC33_11560 [Betaproteobacteria bacterium]
MTSLHAAGCRKRAADHLVQAKRGRLGAARIRQVLTDEGVKPVLAFRQKTALADCLNENQSTSSGAWLRLAKKASGLPTATYDDALDVALCFGRIDGTGKSDSEEYWPQKFTPRGKRSIWSKALLRRAQAQLRGA